MAENNSAASENADSAPTKRFLLLSVVNKLETYIAACMFGGALGSLAADGFLSVAEKRNMNGYFSSRAVEICLDPSQHAGNRISKVIACPMAGGAAVTTGAIGVLVGTPGAADLKVNTPRSP